MTKWTRRSFIAATGATAACSGAGTSVNAPRAEIDTNADAARAELFRTVPGAEQLAGRASGLLIIPNITEVGFMIGGSYGEGVLMIGQAKIDYFSFATASFGVQVGVQKFHHALFFMTQETLAGFRNSDGWQLGADAAFTTPDQAGVLGVSTSTINLPVHALVFGQKGLIVGATLEGAKYSRLMR